MTPCKHFHIDGALHKPCPECRAESDADRIVELERQNEELRKDAERYRWLRHGDNDELVLQRGPVANDYYWLPRNERLDEMIDKHMASDAAALAQAKKEGSTS